MKEIYQFWITNHVFLYCIAGLAFLGCISRLMLSVHYQRSIKGIRLRKGKNRLLKRIKLEIGQVNNVEEDVVHNVDNFVDKCVYYDKIGKVHLYFFEETGRILLITYGILLTAVAFCGYLYRENINNLLTLLTSSVLGILLVYFLDSVLCVRRKKIFFRCILKEYCEEELHISGKREDVRHMEEKKDKIMSGQEEALARKVEEWKEREPSLRDTDVISDALKRQMSELVEGEALNVRNAGMEAETMKRGVTEGEAVNVRNAGMEASSMKRSVTEGETVNVRNVGMEAEAMKRGAAEGEAVNVRNVGRKAEAMKRGVMEMEAMEKRTAENGDMKERAMEPKASESGDFEKDPLDKTWDLKEVIAATKEKIKEQEGQAKKKKEKEPVPGINLSERDEKIIMDILREYL